MEFIIENDKIFYSENGNELAYILLDYTPDGLVVLDKVFVDPSLRGQGIASKIMTFAADYFKKEKITVVPLCSYAHTWYLRHEDYSDGIKMPEEGPRCKL
ncbi:MAG: GNAT family N-acetyltransferase [Pleomorphochaeta sp.]